MANHRHHQEGRNRRFLFHLYWLIIWALIYSVLFMVLDFLLNELFRQSGFYKIEIVHILILGLFFSIGSRIIYDLIKNKRIYMGSDVFIFWTITYGLSIWFAQFLWNLLVEKLQGEPNIFLSYLFIGLVVTILIMLVKRIEFGIKQPSQIMTGVLLMFVGILFFRFSRTIFGTYWQEGMAWSWLFGLAFIIGGFLMVLAWWRNNVLQHRIGIKIGHWK